MGISPQLLVNAFSIKLYLVLLDKLSHKLLIALRQLLTHDVGLNEGVLLFVLLNDQ
jgi:hypothetical protein